MKIYELELQRYCASRRTPSGRSLISEQEAKEMLFPLVLCLRGLLHKAKGFEGGQHQVEDKGDGTTSLLKLIDWGNAFAAEPVPESPHDSCIVIVDIGDDEEPTIFFNTAHRPPPSAGQGRPSTERRLCGTNTGTASEGTRGEMQALKKLPTDERRIGNELQALGEEVVLRHFVLAVGSDGEEYHTFWDSISNQIVTARRYVLALRHSAKTLSQFLDARPKKGRIPKSNDSVFLEMEMYGEQEAKEVLFPLVLFLRELLHKAKVTHRDLKAANISQDFMMPEKRLRHGEIMDIRGLGSVMGELLYGPHKRRGCCTHFYRPLASPEAYDLYDTLTRRPHTLNYDTILRHPWFSRAFSGHWVALQQPMADQASDREARQRVDYDGRGPRPLFSFGNDLTALTQTHTRSVPLFCVRLIPTGTPRVPLTPFTPLKASLRRVADSRSRMVKACISLNIHEVLADRAMGRGEPHQPPHHGGASASERRSLVRFACLLSRRSAVFRDTLVTQDTDLCRWVRLLSWPVRRLLAAMGTVSSSGCGCGNEQLDADQRGHQQIVESSSLRHLHPMHCLDGIVGRCRNFGGKCRATDGIRWRRPSTSPSGGRNGNKRFFALMHKTQLCRDFMSGRGCSQAMCPYAHGEGELREAPSRQQRQATKGRTCPSAKQRGKRNRENRKKKRDEFTTRAFTMKLADPANKPVEDYYDEARLDVQRELLAMANTSEAEFQESKRRRAHQLAEEDGKTKGDNHYYFQARGFCATLWCTRCACAVCK
ncbi:unnamed protein product [Vitrella brassicaformis CCMP3155]|uniref:C3H1-type domain-containing protein n=1 Tax=Vitrella brassicaformis (strain CCMP3155) TaxID=1169540 RepID=A0A0G4H8C3_VITBC|nr:unnamed protein product [Vitrella brassicaformis CCMP3155]|eukprot:CEM40110.1 unnamed protein product [Vitrella brassicaformis CCMP3155]